MVSLSPSNRNLFPPTSTPSASATPSSTASRSPAISDEDDYDYEDEEFVLEDEVRLVGET